jgi:hypothetical protein
MATTYSKNPVIKGNFNKFKGYEDNLDREQLKELAIRKGQAANCAVASAAELGKLNDTRFFFTEYLRWFQLLGCIQKSRLEDVVTALDSPEFLHLLSNVEEHLKYLKEKSE